MALVALLVGVYFTASGASGSTVTFTRTYSNCAVISQAQNISIYWNINATYIEIAISAKAPKGWVGVGFDGSGNMTGGPLGFAEIWVVCAPPTGPAGVRTASTRTVYDARGKRLTWAGRDVRGSK